MNSKHSFFCSYHVSLLFLNDNSILSSVRKIASIIEKFVFVFSVLQILGHFCVDKTLEIQYKMALKYKIVEEIGVNNCEIKYLPTFMEILYHNFVISIVQIKIDTFLVHFTQQHL